MMGGIFGKGKDSAEREFMILRSILLLLMLLLFVQPGGHAESAEMCTIANDAIVAASKIRGLSQKRKVPCEVHDKPKVRAYILEAIETQVPKKKLLMEELVYQTLGFIPKDFNYQDGLIDLYLSQLGGYYDPKKRYFVMAAWMPAMMQNTIAVHELTHALQDQYFDLEPFIDPEKYTTDQVLARMALVEGDATAVMMDYTRSLIGQQPLSESEDVEGIMMQNVLSVALVAGVDNIPQSLSTLLIFPYTSGLRFVHDLIKKGGYKQIDRVFKRPPNTTEQILHPEKYTSQKKEFVEIEATELQSVLSGEQELLHTDVLGEFSTSSMLGMFHEKGGAGAASAAAGWGGDRVAVYRDKTSGDLSVLWRQNWDSPKDAEEYFDAYTQLLKVRESDLDLTQKGQAVAQAGKLTFSLEENQTFLKITGLKDALKGKL